MEDKNDYPLVKVRTRFRYPDPILGGNFYTRSFPVIVKYNIDLRIIDKVIEEKKIFIPLTEMGGIKVFPLTKNGEDFLYTFSNMMARIYYEYSVKRLEETEFVTTFFVISRINEIPDKKSKLAVIRIPFDLSKENFLRVYEKSLLGFARSKNRKNKGLLFNPLLTFETFDTVDPFESIHNRKDEYDRHLFTDSLDSNVGSLLKFNVIFGLNYKRPYKKNPTKNYSSKDCRDICNDTEPNVIFCNRGHTVICVRCDNDLANLESCPLCKTPCEI